MSEPLGFIHVPKTAGTTFVSTLARNYPIGRVQLPNVFFREDELHERLAAARGDPSGRVRFLHGHVPLSMRDEFPAGTRFISFLREPLVRAYSNYRHMYNRLIDTGEAPPLEDPQIPDNLQARMLCGLPDPLTRPADDALLAAAISELEGLAFCGLLERFAESMLLAQERLGLRWVAYRRENVRPPKPLDPDVERILRSQNELDRALYDHALQILEPELRPFARRAAALDRAGEALTARRAPRDPRALAYVASFGAAEVQADVQRRFARRHRWRRWRSARALRRGLQIVRLWR